MDDETAIIEKPKPKPPQESVLWGVSVRGWIVVMVMATICLRELAVVMVAIVNKSQIEQIKEPFYGVVMGLIGFYFGQKNTSSTTNQKQ